MVSNIILDGNRYEIRLVHKRDITDEDVENICDTYKDHVSIINKI